MPRLLLLAAIVATAAQPIAPARVAEARISPDGQVIAFTRQADGDGGLYRISFAGTGELRLLAGRVSAVRWSPDGAEVGCVLHATTAAPGVVRILPATGGTGRTIARDGRSIESFEWSADGRSLVLQSRPAAARTGTARLDVVLANGDPPPPALAKSPQLPAPPVVTPRSGTQVLFTSMAGLQHAATIGNGVETWIDVIDPASGARVTVMPSGLARILGPSSWSADGQRFTVVAAGGDHGPEVFAGSRPIAVKGDSPGAPPPAVRRLTFTRE